MRAVKAVLALAAVIVPGIGHGFWTGRWTASSALAEAPLRLARMPLELAGWQGKDLQIDPRQIAQAELTGYLSRDYRRSGDSGRMSVLLACGRPGPVSVHTPEICYVGAGFRVVESPRKVQVELRDSSAELMTAKFVKPTPAGDIAIRIYWSWKGSGAWQTPSMPRWTFGGEPVLHKLYVIQPLAGPDVVSDDACLQFIKEFVSEAQISVFAS